MGDEDVLNWIIQGYCNKNAITSFWNDVFCVKKEWHRFSKGLISVMGSMTAITFIKMILEEAGRRGLSVK